MIPLRSSILNSAIFALAFTTLAMLLSISLGSYLGPDRYVLYLGAVWVSAWYYGRTGGLTATIVSGALIVFLFVRPWTFMAPAPTGNVVLVSSTFLAMALLITWVTASWRESRQLLSATLSSIADAVIATDSEGKVTFLNPVAAPLPGWP